MPTQHRAKIVVVVIAFLSLTSSTFGSSQGVALSIGNPGIGAEEANLFIALPFVNDGTITAYDVKVTMVSLGTARLIKPTTFPLALGNLTSKGRAVVQITFLGRQLRQRQRYVLETGGTYTAGEKTVKFSARRSITLPSDSPGSAQSNVTSVLPHSVTGAQFPPKDVVIPAEVNEPGPPIPIGISRGDQKPITKPTSVQPGRPLSAPEGKRAHIFTPLEDTGDDNPSTVRSGATVLRDVLYQPGSRDLVFVKNTSFGASGGQPNDPSGASGGLGVNGPQVVLASGNTYGSLSTDGGSTFTQLNPTKIFPSSDAAGNLFDGGLCCDQVIHYSPTVDRFIWLMQFRSGSNNQNRLRIAAASPETLVSTQGTGWTYWDLTSATFNLGNNSMDYPDMSVGNNFLYISVDALGANGLLVARIPLAELRDGVTLHIGYTTPKDSTSAYGVHLIQNPVDEIFWAGHPTTSLLRVFSWKEGSNSYSWRDVKINGYPSSDFTSPSPDGSNWLASLFSGGPGGIRLLQTGTDEIWFEWMGGRSTGFPQPHIQLVRIAHSNFNVIEQTQIWNASFAFGYASFTVANNVVGVSLGFGGGAFYGSPAVGIMGDGVLYSPCDSTKNAFRYGDYTTVRQAFPNGALFSAVGYCVGTNQKFDPHYILYGRSSDVNPTPISSIEHFLGTNRLSPLK